MVFDEPVNGLDPDGILWFRTFIQEEAARGSTILLSSHHMSELALIADRVVMIRNGRIAADGTVADFTQTDSDLKVYVEMDRLHQTRQLLTEHGFSVTNQESGLWVTGGDPAEISRVVVLAGHDLQHVARIVPTLEESYFDRLSTQQKKVI